jgi:hypothetical protein
MDAVVARKLRKRTIFIPCDKHRSHMSAETRSRRAELMIEGGYAGHAPCDCRMKPGIDLYTPEFVAAHPNGCGIQGQ